MSEPDPIVERARAWLAHCDECRDVEAEPVCLQDDCTFARYVVRNAAIVEATVAQEKAATAFSAAQEQSRRVAFGSFREEDEAAEAEGIAETAWNTSATATEQAVRAARQEAGDAG